MRPMHTSSTCSSPAPSQSNSRQPMPSFPGQPALPAAEFDDLQAEAFLKEGQALNGLVTSSGTYLKTSQPCCIRYTISCALAPHSARQAKVSLMMPYKAFLGASGNTAKLCQPQEPAVPGAHSAAGNGNTHHLGQSVCHLAS